MKTRETSMSKTVLVTGGAGYIGSHTVLALVGAGWAPVIFDNFCNSSKIAVDRLCELTQREIICIEGDVRDTALCAKTLADYDCQSVIHFAGLKAVGESHEKPLEYYSANVGGSLSLMQAMQEAGAKHFIFSSSATVYGPPEFLPYTEDHPLNPQSPYGQTKRQVEDILRDASAREDGLAHAILRYFNPVGADVTGRIGEDPRDIPNNLMPFVAQVAVGRREQLSVYGDDYETPDGTGVRDYIHVTDLARAHVLALERLTQNGESFTVNLGTGQGYSVLEMVKAFETASGQAIPYKIAPRRSGDIAIFYADSAGAQDLLGWKAEKSLNNMCTDHWRWQSTNPNGYDG